MRKSRNKVLNGLFTLGHLALAYNYNISDLCLQFLQQITPGLII